MFIQYYIASKKGNFTTADLLKSPLMELILPAGKRNRALMILWPLVSAEEVLDFDPFADFLGRTPSGNLKLCGVDADCLFFSVQYDEASRSTRGRIQTWVWSFFIVLRPIKRPCTILWPGKQLDAILKKNKAYMPWGRKFNDQQYWAKEVNYKTVKKWTKLKYTRRISFSFSAGKLRFQESLERSKYIVAKNSTVLWSEWQKDFKTFYSSPKQLISFIASILWKMERLSVRQFNSERIIHLSIEVETVKASITNLGISGVV